MVRATKIATQKKQPINILRDKSTCFDITKPIYSA